MSECIWCDRCERPASNADPDARPVQHQIPRIVGGVKIGIEATVERHQCGDCTRSDLAERERRRAITVDQHDPED